MSLMVSFPIEEGNILKKILRDINICDISGDTLEEDSKNYLKLYNDIKQLDRTDDCVWLSEFFLKDEDKSDIKNKYYYITDNTLWVNRNDNFEKIKETFYTDDDIFGNEVFSILLYIFKNITGKELDHCGDFYSNDFIVDVKGHEEYFNEVTGEIDFDIWKKNKE
tara:strand:+ start:25976 stop:26470 length:495 start_codon:yes stop_codon:yes gene_type:complete